MISKKNTDSIPLLSIIVPVYNAQEYLQQCISSLVAQTYRNIEIILVDDGSTDESGTICDEYTQKDSRVQVIHQDNQGVKYTRINGLKKARGMYCTFIDSDDWIDVNAYQELMEICQEKDIDVVSFGDVREYEDHSILKMDQIPAGLYDHAQILHIIQDYTEKNAWFSYIFNTRFGTKIIRTCILKNAFKENGTENIINNEDTIIVLSCILSSQKVYVQKKCYYHYRIREGSMSHIDYSNAYENILTVSDKLITLCIKNKVDSNYLRYLLFFCLAYQKPEYFLGNNENKIICFPRVKRNNRIIIYGKGRFSKLLQEYLHKTKFCFVCDVIDITDIAIKKDHLSEYDWILIAIIDGEETEKSRQLLISNGISNRRICNVEKDELTFNALPIALQQMIERRVGENRK